MGTLMEPVRLRPTGEEMMIPLDVGEEFPPIRSASKACFWTFKGV